MKKQLEDANDKYGRLVMNYNTLHREMKEMALKKEEEDDKPELHEEAVKALALHVHAVPQSAGG